MYTLYIHIYLNIHTHVMYIHTHTYTTMNRTRVLHHGLPLRREAREASSQSDGYWLALLVKRYLSNTASSVLSTALLV